MSSNSHEFKFLEQFLCLPNIELYSNLITFNTEAPNYDLANPINPWKLNTNPARRSIECSYWWDILAYCVRTDLVQFITWYSQSLEGATDTNIPLSKMTRGEITIKKSMIQYKHQNIYTRKKSFIYEQLKWLVTWKN